jgi:hypothetical protein
MIRRWLGHVARYIRTPSGVSEETCESIREEIKFHLVQAAREELARGVPPAKACETSITRFGDVQSALRGCTDSASNSFARIHRLHLATTAALVVAVMLLAGFVWMKTRPIAVGDGDIVGRVVDQLDHPVENAHVLAVVKTWPKQAFRQVAYAAVTRSDGSFEIEDVYPTNEKYAVQLAILADGHQLRSDYVTLPSGTLEPMTIHLPATQELSVRFETASGQPLPGVDVFPAERVEPGGDRHLVYFCSAGPVVRHSDSQGRVPLSYFSPGDAASLYVRTPGGEWNLRQVEVPNARGELIVRLAAEEASSGTSNGQ